MKLGEREICIEAKVRGEAKSGSAYNFRWFPAGCSEANPSIAAIGPLEL